MGNLAAPTCSTSTSEGPFDSPCAAAGPGHTGIVAPSIESLCPVRVPFRGANTLFAISGEPVSAWLAVPGLILLAAVVIFLSALRIRKLEVNYGTE